MRFKLFFVLLIISGFSNFIFAQDKKEDDEVLRVDTQLVDVPVVITDKTGKPILNLKQNNFVIYEDGKRQETADFAATNVPFEVALLLDTSGSTRSDLSLIQRAAENFINSLRVGDKVSIIAFKSSRIGNKSTATSEVLNALTDDRTKLKSVLAEVKTRNGTPYYDGLLQIDETVFKDAPKDDFRGRRALVALTDGVDSTSAADFAEAREQFNQAGIVSYFIQVDTREFFEENLLGDCEGAMRFSAAQIKRYYRTFYPKSKIEKVSGFCQLGDFERLDISKSLYQLADVEMQTLANASGGKVFAVADLSEARAAFQKVAQDIGTKYSLGYYPSNEKRDGTYRKIKIELKGIPVGATVRAREGYTAPTN
ncbi:MAG: VWA domain-containing protein [Pyrinomonadaceae bacterium]|nr:VWA domain-containing protein [Pyrinomonadaceae bacterium]